MPRPPSQQTAVPWHTPRLWLEATAAMAQTVRRRRANLSAASATANRIYGLVDSLDEPLTVLCTLTCSACQDVCCRRAKVWYDFRDLLFIQLSGQAQPPRQTLSQRSGRCRYLKNDGCALSRSRRPFICLWYLCPQQKKDLAIIQKGFYVEFHERIDAIKKERRLLEVQFVAGVI